MSRLTRVVQKIFGSGAGIDGVAVYGSTALGSPAFSTDPAVLQTPQYVTGIAASVIAGTKRLPILEEDNGVNFVNTYQLSYIFQEGIPEWNAETTYYTAGISIVKLSGTTQLFATVSDANIGHTPVSGTTDANWQYLGDLANLVNAGSLPSQAANTATVNNTTGAASPIGLAMGSSTILARLATGNIVAATVAQIRTLLGIIFTQTFTSADTSYTPGTPLPFNHGLGVVPKVVNAFLINQTADGGYAPGDVVNAPLFGDQTGLNTGLGMYNDATTINLLPAAGGYTLIAKDASGDFDITHGNWKFRIIAYA